MSKEIVIRLCDEDKKWLEEVITKAAAASAKEMPQANAQAMTAAMRDMIARTNAYRIEDERLNN